MHEQHPRGCAGGRQSCRRRCELHLRGCASGQQSCGRVCEAACRWRELHPRCDATKKNEGAVEKERAVGMENEWIRMKGTSGG